MTAYKYSLYIYHNFFLDNVFSTDRLHFPDITQLFLTPHPNIFLYTSDILCKEPQVTLISSLEFMTLQFILGKFHIKRTMYVQEQ